MSERRKVLEKFESQKEYMDKRVSEGIEKYRKGDAKITVTDKNGNAIDGATVKINQKSHDFRFGANLLMLDEFESAEKNAKYREIFADTFNMGTLPFYWDTLEPEKGQPRYEKGSPRVYRRPAIDLCIEYCEENGIEPREHALAYEYFFPKWLYNAELDEIKALYENRCREIAERYADKINTIEVTNEIEWDKGKTALYESPDFIEFCFKTARKYFKNNQLVINEGTNACWRDRCRTTDKYYANIELNKLKGAQIDAVGMQFHMFDKREEEYNATRSTYNPIWAYDHLDMYARFDNPIQITEVTIPAYSNAPEDEAIQAEIIDKMYSIWFSHPNVEQIVYWNLVDGYAALWSDDWDEIRASQGDMTIGENYYYGGLLRYDMSPKPAFNKIRELIKERWHTELNTVTNDNGIAAFRGFYGEYDVKITSHGKTVTKTVHLSKNGENNFDIEL